MGYALAAFQTTYERPIYLVLIDELRPDPSIKAPLARRQRGRPPTTRIRKGRWARKKYKCSNCGCTTHNKRKCRFQPRTNGRAQRQQDRAIDSEETPTIDRTSIEDSLTDPMEFSSNDDDEEFDEQVDRYWNMYRQEGCSLTYLFLDLETQATPTIRDPPATSGDDEAVD
jgi:hypothetical protein